MAKIDRQGRVSYEPGHEPDGWAPPEPDETEDAAVPDETGDGAAVRSKPAAAKAPAPPKPAPKGAEQG